MIRIQAVRGYVGTDLLHPNESSNKLLQSSEASAPHRSVQLYRRLAWRHHRRTLIHHRVDAFEQHVFAHLILPTYPQF